MKILITGGTGYIAIHTALAAILNGHEIILLDNLSYSHLKVLANLKKITNQHIVFLNLDVRNTLNVRGVLEKYNIDAVIHFAALKDINESFLKPLNYFSNNLGGTISLLEAMNCVGLKSLVFSSTAAVYGEAKYSPVDEKHPIVGNSPYAQSKIYVENILTDLAISDTSWKICSLRYFNPVGADARLIDKNHKGLSSNLLPRIAKVANKKVNHLEIYGADFPTIDGTAIRDYIHINDLADSHLMAIEKINVLRGCNFINIGTGKGYSVLEAIKSFERVSEKRVPYLFTEKRPGDVAISYADASKADKLLNWKAKNGIDEMCENIWKWQISKKN